jgi:hypothetical protein
MFDVFRDRLRVRSAGLSETNGSPLLVRADELDGSMSVGFRADACHDDPAFSRACLPVLLVGILNQSQFESLPDPIHGIGTQPSRTVHKPMQLGSVHAGQLGYPIPRHRAVVDDRP